MVSTSILALASTEQFCIVCGAGSHRNDWRNKFNAGGKTFVGCDVHTSKEMQDAITAKLAADTPKA